MLVPEFVVAPEVDLALAVPLTADAVSVDDVPLDAGAAEALPVDWAL